MKNIFFAIAIAFFASVIFMQQAAAQGQDIMSFNLDDDMPDLSKPIIINLPETFTSSDSVSAVNQRAVKDFQKSFKEVTNPVWYKTYDGGYIARFTGDAVNNIVAYNSKGAWQHTIRRYNEDKLPHDIKYAVKSSYFDFTITFVDEVQVEDQLIYLIRLQDEKNIKTVRYSNGEIEEIESFKKG